MSAVLTLESVELLAQLAYVRAANEFYVFRQLTNPTLKWGWFTYVLATTLQEFYADYRAGKRPILIINTPPQHGKSLTVIDFLAWLAGKDPSEKLVYTSFSDRLCVRANLRMQRVMDSPKYQEIFPGTELSHSSNSGYLRNTNILEFVANTGYFRATTVGGPITGEELSIGVIDDPIKGRAEANSEKERDRVWNWLTDDFLSRFAELGAMILIMTRWHVDDPGGRLLENFPKSAVKVLRFPAIAEVNEEYRYAREPLFPEHKSLDFLKRQQQALSRSSWEALWQQNPIVVGGELFPIEKLRTVKVFDRSRIRISVRSWDKAGSTASETAAYTAGVLMHKMDDGTFVIEHVERGQWSALTREQRILYITQTDAANCPNYTVVVEQEPGSGGKESAEATIRALAGYKVIADRPVGNKELRAEPLATQVQGGNVSLCAGTWQYSFLNEAAEFPNGKYKDQVDAASAAFNYLTALGGKRPVDVTLSWVS